MTSIDLRRTFIALACLAFAIDGSASRADEGAPPNIIFILADDLGYGDLGCYGQQRIQTPCLDRLAAGGLRFTQAYAGSTVCAPSRGCLMTGQHTGHATIRGNGNVPLRADEVTIAEMLRDAGYRTGAIGKWGLGEPGTTGIPNRQGFDSWFGYLNQNHAHNYYPDYLWRNEEKVALENVVKGGVATKKVSYSHDLFAEEALAFVEQEPQKPFFLYLALTIPHANNEAKNLGMETPSLAPYEDQPWPAPEQGRAAMITRMDRDIGRLVERLETLGLAEKTILFFSSDNGPHREGGSDPDFFDSNGPLRGIKRDLYEGGIRVPLIAYAPGRIKPGVSEHVCAFWDVLPTLAELAGAKASEGLDGISFVPTLKGDSAAQHKHDFLYWEFHEGGFHQAVRAGDWKGVRKNLSGPLEIYNLFTDLGETHDVASDHPAVVYRLELYLKQARTESVDWPIAGQ